MQHFRRRMLALAAADTQPGNRWGLPRNLPGEFELRINSGANISEDVRDEIQSTFGNLISVSHLEEYCAFNTAYSQAWQIGWAKSGLA